MEGLSRPKPPPHGFLVPHLLCLPPAALVSGVVAVVFVFGGKDKNTCPPFKLKACVHMLCLLRKYIRVPAHDRSELGQAGSVLYRGLAAAIYSH